MIRTNRNFTNIETKEVFALYQNNDTKEFSLISDGSENLAAGTQVNGFYISAHTSTDIKINNSKIVSLQMGTFYNLKEGEKVTHRKFCGFDKFSKI